MNYLSELPDDFPELIAIHGDVAVQQLQPRIPSVQEIQLLVLEAGYQWVEHIYNDGGVADCSLSLTKDRDPVALLERPPQMRCGRFSRHVCWLDVFIWLRSKGEII